MKHLIYSPEGEPVSDFEAENYAYKLLKQDEINTSSQNVVDWVRVLVKDGLIDWNDITVHFHDQELKIDKNGSMNEWPHGFCDTNLNALTRLLSR